MNDEVFQVGDRVYVRSLKRTGIITRISKNGTVVVTTDTMEVRLTRDQLKVHSAAGSNKKKKKDHPNTKRWKEQLRDRTVRSRDQKPVYVDLHGMRALDAEERISSAIDQALRNNADSMIIIHGHGKGVLKRTVHNVLGSLSAVKGFKQDPENAGQTLVYF